MIQMFAVWQISVQRQWNCHHSSAHCCDHACEFGIFMGTCQHLIACPDDLPDTLAKIDDFVNSLATEKLITIRFGRENMNNLNGAFSILQMTLSITSQCVRTYSSPMLLCAQNERVAQRPLNHRNRNGEMVRRAIDGTGVECDNLFIRSGCRKSRFWATINEIITSTGTYFQIHQ